MIKSRLPRWETEDKVKRDLQNTQRVHVQKVLFLSGRFSSPLGSTDWLRAAMTSQWQEIWIPKEAHEFQRGGRTWIPKGATGPSPKPRSTFWYVAALAWPGMSIYGRLDGHHGCLSSYGCCITFKSVFGSGISVNIPGISFHRSTISVHRFPGHHGMIGLFSSPTSSECLWNCSGTTSGSTRFTMLGILALLDSLGVWLDPESVMKDCIMYQKGLLAKRWGLWCWGGASDMDIHPAALADPAGVAIPNLNFCFGNLYPNLVSGVHYFSSSWLYK